MTVLPSVLVGFLALETDDPGQDDESDTDDDPPDEFGRLSLDEAGSDCKLTTTQARRSGLDADLKSGGGVGETHGNFRRGG